MKMVDFYIDFLCDVMGSCCIFVDQIERGGIKDDNCGLGCLNKKIECQYYDWMNVLIEIK